MKHLKTFEDFGHRFDPDFENDRHDDWNDLDDDFDEEDFDEDEISKIHKIEAKPEIDHEEIEHKDHDEDDKDSDFYDEREEA